MNDLSSPPSPPYKPTIQSNPWISIATILTLIGFYPIGLILLWGVTKWNKKIKIIITLYPLIVGILAVILIITIGAFHKSSNSIYTKSIPSVSPTTNPSSSGSTCPPNTKKVINYDTTYITQPADPKDVCELDITNSSYTYMYDTSSRAEITKKAQQSSSDFTLSIESVKLYPNLKILNISSDSFQDYNIEIQLPDAVWQSKNLQVLNISYMPFKSGVLPKEIFSLPHLKILAIYGTNLKTLPAEIGFLSDLTDLALGANNKLTSFPPGIGNLKNLTTLDLSIDNLTSLPDDFTKLQNLKQLDLSDNSFVIFPTVLTTLQNLEELNMQNNKLTSLPPGIGNLKNIKKLIFSNWSNSANEECGTSVCQKGILTWRKNGNHFSVFPDTMSQFSSLQELDLTNISISDSEKAHLKQLLPNTKIDFDTPEPLSNYAK